MHYDPTPFLAWRAAEEQAEAAERRIFRTGCNWHAREPTPAEIENARLLRAQARRLLGRMLADMKQIASALRARDALCGVRRKCDG
ncbi:hypothetical protein [Xenophilus sp. Marseille-Q4582]|uniref:hypothetical protein n=1 Tax=Xenophilus sp. Marseille-Q4582 TaxID=2866600 RepID=UPI001CE4636D|nr:hypothetical protein [Xenophilus sp. Marseille-Q4582]